MKTRRSTRPRRGVSLAAVVGVGVLLFGPVIAPFTTIELGLASTDNGTDGQNYTAIDGEGVSITRDSWSLTSTFFVAVSADVRAAQEYALSRLQEMGMDEAQFGCLVNLWNRESHWNYRSENKSSGAYGIPQALPGSKMASIAADWQTNPKTQIEWGLGYITGRYGTPCAAWDHSERKGWY